MKHKILILAVWLYVITPVCAQTSDLARLLQEREKIYQSYDSLSRENNALFGGRSKKDYQQMVLSLHHIISKDNEIIREVRRTSFEKESNLFGQTRLNSDRASELQAEVNRLNNQLKFKSKELQEEKSASEALIGSLHTLQVGIFILTALVVGIGYFMYQQRKKS